MKVPKIFNNEIVHYALIFLAVLNVVGYVASKAYECLLLFGVGYYAVNTHINNVGLSILAALFLSNFVFGCGRVKESFIEGMKGAKEHLMDASTSAQLGALDSFNDSVKKKDKLCKEGFSSRIVEGLVTVADANQDQITKSAVEIDNAAKSAIDALEEKKKAEDAAEKQVKEEEEENK